MAGITQTIPNYILGISEQPDELKSAGQVVDLKNGFPDITDGLKKRPGGKLISTIAPNSGELSWFDIYEDDNEQYIGNVDTRGVIQVWRARDGAAVPIDYANVAGTNLATYLSGWTKPTDIQSLVVNYNTFLTNRTTTTAMASTTSPVEVHEAIIELKTVSYGRQYALDLCDPDDNTVTTTNRATAIAVRESLGGLDTNDGQCRRASRESIKGSNNLCYEIDLRCQPIAEGGGSTSNHPNYDNSYQAFALLEFGGEGHVTGNTQDFTMEKGATGTVEVKAHTTMRSQASLTGAQGPNDSNGKPTCRVRPAPTAANGDTSITAAGILGGMKTALDALKPSGMTTTIIGNCLHIKHTAAFNVTSPEIGLMQITSSDTNVPGDLPASCRHGYIVKVANASEADEDDYYLRFHVDNIGTGVTADHYGTGVWEETVKPGIKTTLDSDTLPIRLQRGDPSTQYVIATTNVSTSTHRITITGHGLSTGDPILYDNGDGTTLGGLSDNTTYYVIKYNDDVIQLADNLTNANAGTAKVFTGQGNNAQTLTSGTWSINGTNPAHYPAGIFRLTKPPWITRIVGDEETNPEPSFIGKKISKLLFFRNRLVMLSENNVVLSQTNDFYNFFSKSAQTVSPTDPIDIKSSSLYPTVLYDGIEVNSGLLLHSSNQQFMLTTDSDALTPTTAKVNYLSSYNYNPEVVPFSLGMTNGFVNSTGKNARFFEMAEIRREGEPIVTEQSKIIAKKLPLGISEVTASKENGLILFGTTKASTATDVWGYRYYSNGESRIQSSWFRWELPGNLKHHVILDDVYYAVLQNGSTYTLEAYDVKKQTDTTVIDTNIIHLDTHTEVAALASNTYNSTTQKTVFPKPAGYNSSKQLAVFNNNAGNDLGRYGLVTVNGSNLEVAGNWTGAKLILGYVFDWLVELPKIYPTVTQGGQTRMDTRSSLVIHRLKFSFGAVGVIETTLKRRGRPDYSETYESIEWDQVVGNNVSIADEYIHTIPVYENTKNLTVQLKSSHATPSTLHSLNWEGDYNPKYYRRA